MLPEQLPLQHIRLEI